MLLFVAILAVSLASATGECTPAKGGVCFFVPRSLTAGKNGATRSEAAKLCSSTGAHLAAPHATTDLLSLKTYVSMIKPPLDHIWTGFRMQPKNDSFWRWTEMKTHQELFYQGCYRSSGASQLETDSNEDTLYNLELCSKRCKDFEYVGVRQKPNFKFVCNCVKQIEMTFPHPESCTLCNTSTPLYCGVQDSSAIAVYSTSAIDKILFTSSPTFAVNEPDMHKMQTTLPLCLLLKYDTSTQAWAFGVEDCRQKHEYMCEHTSFNSLGECHSGTPISGQCVDAIPKMLTWYDARMACRSNFGGYLVSFPTGSTGLAAMSLRKTSVYWIGVINRVAVDERNYAQVWAVWKENHPSKGNDCQMFETSSSQVVSYVCDTTYESGVICENRDSAWKPPKLVPHLQPLGSQPPPVTMVRRTVETRPNTGMVIGVIIGVILSLTLIVAVTCLIKRGGRKHAREARRLVDNEVTAMAAGMHQDYSSNVQFPGTHAHPA